MNVYDTLMLAADLIEERGWTSGVDGWGRMQPLCIEGAITAAAGLPTAAGGRLDLYQCDAYWAVADYLALEPTPRVCPVKQPVWGWNDVPGRTAAEVIETLRAAAATSLAKDAAVAAREHAAEGVSA